MTDGVIVGDKDDPHVEAVIRYAPDSLVIDAHSLSLRTFGVVDGTLSLSTRDEVDILEAVDGPARGWIRRVAPQDWFIDMESESKQAAIQLAWLTLLTAFVRTGGVEWLSDLESISAGENKLVMAAMVTKMGIVMPTTVVTNSTRLLTGSLDGEVIVKALGPGHYFEGGAAFNVFAEGTDASRLTESALSEAPFIVQRRLRARSHFRVVTVRDRAFVCRLDASGLPADWRRVPEAHSNFRYVENHSELNNLALRAASALRLGFSSQDWVEDDDRLYLLDANPGGQWAFLPDPVPGLVGQAIAEWLHGN